MTLTIEIRSEVQAELARLAAVEGRVVESYAARLLEEAARPRTPVSLNLKDMVKLFARPHPGCPSVKLTLSGRRAVRRRQVAPLQELCSLGTPE